VSLPTARTPDPFDAPPLRWGVMGTGWIAERFIRSVQRHTRQQFTAIGSRNAERSAAFAARRRLSRRGLRGWSVAYLGDLAPDR
jgi:hypothetical protein